MKSSRRNFLKSAAITSGAAITFPHLANAGHISKKTTVDYSKLDEALKKPVLKRELFSSPVIIESVELLHLRNNCMFRVRSKDGAVGISAGHPFIAKNSYPMVPNILARHFEGKDARDLDKLIYNAVEGSVKNQGIPLNVQVAGRRAWHKYRPGLFENT